MPTAAAMEKLREEMRSEQRYGLMLSGRFDGGAKERKIRDTYKALEDLGERPLIVEAGLGQTFGDSTVAALDNMWCLVPFGEPDYAEKTDSVYSSYGELKYTIENHIPMIPLKLSDVWPPSPPDLDGRALNKFAFSKDLVYIDLSEGQFDARDCAEKIAKAAKKLKAHLLQHTFLQRVTRLFQRVSPFKRRRDSHIGWAKGDNVIVHLATSLIELKVVSKLKQKSKARPRPKRKSKPKSESKSGWTACCGPIGDLITDLYSTSGEHRLQLSNSIMDAGDASQAGDASNDNNDAGALIWSDPADASELRADQSISLGQLAQGDHEIQAYVTMGKQIDGDKVLQLQCKPITVTKDANGNVSPRFLDLGLQHSKVTFAKNGTPLSEGAVRCTLRRADGAGDVEYIKSLDASGSTEDVCSSSVATACSMHAESADGGMSAEVNVPYYAPREVEAPGLYPPNDIHVDSDPPSAFPDFALRHTVFLGDISGSMANGNMIGQLRQGLLDIVERYGETGDEFAIAAWNSHVYWPTGQPKWLTESDRGACELWIARLRPGGGNNMRYALEEALKTGPLENSVHHVVLMCDGDMKPFAVDGTTHNYNFQDLLPKPASFRDEADIEADDWEAFIASIPCSVHSVSIVAFGEGAHPALQRMAHIARGKFYKFGAQTS